MISKMKPAEQGGSRLAIVFNGSPLFTGAAGSGESEIRRWIIENDWLEAVVALPDQLFYNTGISTYFWIVTNRKTPERRGKVQLIDARDLWQKMRKSLGEKRKEISRRPDRRDHPPLRRLHRGRPGQDLPQRGVRLPAHHRRAPAAASAGRSPTTPSPPSRPTEGRRQRSTSPTSRALVDALAGAARRAWRHATGEPRQALVDADPGRLAGLDAAGRQGRLRRPRRPRPRRPDRHQPQGRRPNPTPTCATRRTSRCPPMPVTLRSRRRPAASPPPSTAEPSTTTSTAEVHALRPRRLGRPHQDQDRLRDPPHPPLLRYVPPRPLAEIDAEIKQLEAEIQDLLREVTE